MSDDWSLTNHKTKPLCLSPCRNSIHVYPDYTIETLRKKLIADLEKAWNHILLQEDRTNREYWFMTEWKASIDNRFGYEES